MREIGAFEAKNRVGQLLDLVEQGEEVVITGTGRRLPASCHQKQAPAARQPVRPHSAVAR